MARQLLNQLNVGVHRSYKDSGTLADFEDWPEKLGLPNPFGVHGWPTMYAGNFAFDGDNIKTEALTGIVFEDNVSWTKGNHEIQFGAKLRKEYNNVRELQQAAGSHNFGGGWTGLWSEDDGCSASVTPGTVSPTCSWGCRTICPSSTTADSSTSCRMRSAPMSPTSGGSHRKLTLNLGVRWDKWTPYQEK